MVAFMTAAQQLNMLMLDMAAHRKEHPTDDVVSALVNTNVDGEALTDAEIAAFFILLVVAGNETTRNAISHGLLGHDPEPRPACAVAGRPGGIAATGVDEIVRWGSPVIWMRRTVGGDTVLGGTELHQGDKVIMFYNSANRDEDVFTDPFTFDVRRDPNPHIGFGAAGPHFCLGAHLARQEISVMFRQLFERLARHRGRGRARPPALPVHQRDQAHGLQVHAGARLGLSFFCWPPRRPRRTEIRGRRVFLPVYDADPWSGVRLRTTCPPANSENREF